MPRVGFARNPNHTLWPAYQYSEPVMNYAQDPKSSSHAETRKRLEKLLPLRFQKDDKAASLTDHQLLELTYAVLKRQADAANRSAWHFDRTLYEALLVAFLELSQFQTRSDRATLDWEKKTVFGSMH